MSYLRFCALTFMIVLPAVMRLADLGWNFAPIGAVALFAGATFRNRWLAFAVPLGAMFASDIALGWHRQNFSYYTFHTMMPVVYFCYAISVCLGFGIRRQWNRLDAEEAGSALAPGGRDAHPHRPGLVPRRMVPVAFGTLGGSLLFFVVTNFGDWVVYYPHTWNSLVECYYVAIPFFRNTLMSDAIGAAVLFGGYEILCRRAALADPTGLLHAR